MLQVWEDPEKYGAPIENGVQYAWPPPASLWAEAMETFELDLTFTISVDDTRVQKKDKVKATVSCTFGRKYAHVTKAGDATGCSAKIRTRSTTLCGEPSAKSWAASNAWVGVTKYVGGQAQKWAQMGYQRKRIVGTTTSVWRRYAETRYGSAPWDRDFHYENGVPSGLHEYKCYLISSLFGTWKYEYDGLLWYQFTDNGWRNVTGTAYQWVAEIYNKEDQMVGTATVKCNYTDCQYSVNWGTFQSANIGTGDLHTDDAAEWGIERVSATAFNVWDKQP